MQMRQFHLTQKMTVRQRQEILEKISIIVGGLDFSDIKKNVINALVFYAQTQLVNDNSDSLMVFNQSVDLFFKYINLTDLNFLQFTLSQLRATNSPLAKTICPIAQQYKNILVDPKIYQLRQLFFAAMLTGILLTIGH